MQRRTRFAPSPTGLLHVGHAYAAMQLEAWGAKHHGEIYLRIEDIDKNRCRAEWTQAMVRDLQYFGFVWQGEVRQQSQALNVYQQALQSLRDLNVLYPCFCTRQDIQKNLQATNFPEIEKFDAYPQTCRYLSSSEQQQRMKLSAFSWRLDAEKAHALIQHPLIWQEGNQSHTVDIHGMGDVILARKDIGTSYHIAVVVDDARQGVTDVVRGEDLCPTTPVHVLLQALLGLPTPKYHHHQLLRHTNGQRLAKSQQSISLHHLREAGLCSDDLRYYLRTSNAMWDFLPTDSASYIAQRLGR